MRVARRVVAVCLVFSAWTGVTASAQDGPGDAIVERRALDHASRLEEAGREEEAMRALENLLDEQPKAVSALVLLVQMADRSGEPARAIARAEAAVAHDASGLPALRQVWIRALQSAGLRDSALSVAERWIEESPAEASAYLELSGLWVRAGDADRAIRALQSGRAAVGSDRLFVQELAALQAERGSYADAAREWRAMLAWGEPGVEAVERWLVRPESDRSVAVGALRAELAEPDATVLERKGGVRLALLLGESAWAREIVAQLSEDLPWPAAVEVLRDYVARARDRGDLAGAAWAAELLVVQARSDDEVIYWTAVAADLSYEAGDLQKARAAFAGLIDAAQPGSDLYELALRRMHELTVNTDPDQAETLLWEHLALYPGQSLPAVEMSVRSAGAWLALGRLDRAREVIERVPPRDAEQAALQAAVLGRIELLGGRPAEARGHLELAAAMPAGDPGVRIEALGLLDLVEQASPADLETLGQALLEAMAAGDAGQLIETVYGWSDDRTTGGEVLSSFVASELEGAGHDEAARSVRLAIVERWSETPEAPRALLALARAERERDPVRAAEWLERLIVAYPESAMAPIARRLLTDMRVGA